MSIVEVHREPLFIQGESVSSVGVHETFRWKESHVRVADSRVPIIESATSKHVLDISWLPAAADAYNISADPKDYVITEVPIVTVGVPNRNMDSFPYEEVSRWSHILGRLVYQTFKGKPTYMNHMNKDPRKAKGVNFDASLRKVGNVWKIIVLSGFDRTKDRDLAEAVAKGTRDKFSMGAYVDYTKCSLHDKRNGPPPAKCCRHKKGDTPNGQLRYDKCYGVNYIENSSVEDPADVFAWSPEVWR